MEWNQKLSLEAHFNEFFHNGPCLIHRNEVRIG